jgi:hypothetical protein
MTERRGRGPATRRPGSDAESQIGIEISGIRTHDPRGRDSRGVSRLWCRGWLSGKWGMSGSNPSVVYILQLTRVHMSAILMGLADLRAQITFFQIR